MILILTYVVESILLRGFRKFYSLKVIDYDRLKIRQRNIVFYIVTVSTGKTQNHNRNEIT